MKIKRIMLSTTALLVSSIIATPFITSCSSVEDVPPAVVYGETFYNLKDLEDTIYNYKFHGKTIKDNWVDKEVVSTNQCDLYNRSLEYNGEFSNLAEIPFYFYDIGSLYAVNQFAGSDMYHLLEDEKNLDIIKKGETIAHIPKNQAALEQTAHDKKVSIDELSYGDKYFFIPWNVSFIKNCTEVIQDSVSKVYYNDIFQFQIKWRGY